jgi:hypothetical protein
MEKIAVYLDEDEAKIFIELRRIAMKSGSVRLNYDKEGRVQSMDEYRHKELLELSTEENTA